MPRSEPLYLSDGEIRDPTPAQEKYPPWLLSIKNMRTGQRRTKKFWSYQKAKKAAVKVASDYPEEEGWDIVVISRCQGYGPPYSKVSDPKLLAANEQRLWWCPYCRSFREFLWRPRTELKHCPHCRISELDFHVRRCNPILWDPDNLRALLMEVKE